MLVWEKRVNLVQIEFLNLNPVFLTILVKALFIAEDNTLVLVFSILV